jgi:hypothetical protein
VVEQRDHLPGERGHRVAQRVVGPVGPAVAEQVEGDDVQPLGRERPGERLVHPARHELPVEQHHPRVAGAVLRVLETISLAEEELADPLGDQHLRNPSATPPYRP